MPKNEVHSYLNTKYAQPQVAKCTQWIYSLSNIHTTVRPYRMICNILLQVHIICTCSVFQAVVCSVRPRSDSPALGGATWPQLRHTVPPLGQWILPPCLERGLGLQHLLAVTRGSSAMWVCTCMHRRWNNSKRTIVTNMSELPGVYLPILPRVII